MTKLKLVFAIAVVTCLASLALAQAGATGNRSGARNYDPKTETTIHGTIKDVAQQTSGRGTGGTHLSVETEQGLVDVHVGPSNYLAKQNVSFTKGDTVEITGSRITIGGTNALIAREIKKDGKTITLRDAQGMPVWSRRGGQR